MTRNNTGVQFVRNVSCWTCNKIAFINKGKLYEDPQFKTIHCCNPAGARHATKNDIDRLIERVNSHYDEIMKVLLDISHSPHK